MTVSAFRSKVTMVINGDQFNPICQCPAKEFYLEMLISNMTLQVLTKAPNFSTTNMHNFAEQKSKI